MNIDWSKAPKGAEAARPETAVTLEAWYRRDTAGLVEQICEGAGCKTWTWMGGRKDFPVGYVLQPKPPILVQHWAGGGLPPVGTVCELRMKSGGWGKAEIKYISQDVCVWLWSRPEALTRQVELGAEVRNMEFRPIRTPEQIAAEERESSAVDLFRSVMNSPKSCSWAELGEERREHYRNLIDQGWQKVPRA